MKSKAIRKVVAKLEPAVREEIMQLWEEYRNRSSPEGNFLSQLNVIAILLQTILYKKENKNFSVQAVWEWAFEMCDDVVCCKLLDEIKKNSRYI